MDVKDSEELELALERIDPELFLLSPRDAEEDRRRTNARSSCSRTCRRKARDRRPRRRRSRDEVDELERAGMDAVVVAAGNVTELVGAAPPEV